MGPHSGSVEEWERGGGRVCSLSISSVDNLKNTFFSL